MHTLIRSNHKFYYICNADVNYSPESFLTQSPNGYEILLGLWLLFHHTFQRAKENDLLASLAVTNTPLQLLSKGGNDCSLHLRLPALHPPCFVTSPTICTTHFLKQPPSHFSALIHMGLCLSFKRCSSASFSWHVCTKKCALVLWSSSIFVHSFLAFSTYCFFTVLLLFIWFFASFENASQTFLRMHWSCLSSLQNDECRCSLEAYRMLPVHLWMLKDALQLL